VAILQRANRFHINDKWPAIGADQVVGHTANPFPRNHPPQLKGLADYLSRRWIEVGTWSVNIRTAQFAHDVFGGVPLPTSHTSHRPFQRGVGPEDSKTGPIQREHATPAQPTLFRGGKIFTIQPFSRKCPIGHALDIPFENWTSSEERRRRNCRLFNPVSTAGLRPARNRFVSRSVHPTLSHEDVHFWARSLGRIAGD
jgi:hypothetical protein